MEMRTLPGLGLRYETTHPWISFKLDLSGCPPQFWMLLGEARSKCDHIRYVPLERETAKELMLLYLAKGVQATTAIEGNTLSEDQVLNRIDGQQELPISQEYMGVEIDNMINAYNQIVSDAMSGDEMRLDRQRLGEMNLAILDGTNHEPDAVPGQIRRHSVAAGSSYVGAPHPDLEFLLDRLCVWINGPSFVARTDPERIPYALIRAIVAHVYLEWIHPFGDGNGRLGRLVEFMILVTGGVPVTAAHILTSHYNETRAEYYRQLGEASRRHGGDVGPFLGYAAQGWVDGLTAAIKRLHRQQEALMWQALVDRAFAHQHSPASHRQALVAHAIGRVDRWVTRHELRELDSALAVAYHEKTSKTVSRDVNKLRDKGFIIVRSDGAIRADMNVVRGLRPFVVGSDDPATR
jgi:Fic family protein